MPSGRAAFVERMQAMMAARPAARIIPPEEASVADLVARHGDKALLVEARQGVDGRPKILAVLDLDKATLADEIVRLSSVDAFAVDAIDRATWLAMQRLASTGLLQFTHESRVLHRSSEFAEEATESLSSDQRAVQLMAEAKRALRMAWVLASGGFPEEVPALLAKAVHKAGAARMADRAVLFAQASTATDADIKRLVEQDVLPADALTTLDTSQPSAGPPADDAVKALVAKVEQLITAIERPVPIMASRRAA
jgi:hypothetical protein